MKKMKECGFVRHVKRTQLLILNLHLFKSAAHIEKELLSRINNILTDKTYTYINPDFEKVDNLIKRAFDECIQHFH